MPKHDIDDDPALALNEQHKLAAQERKRDKILRQIIQAEEERNQASDKIKTLWKKVASEGHDVSEARRALVRLACSSDDNI